MSEPKTNSNPAKQTKFPTAPAWAVGADAEHTGPSGMGPGTDRPGFGQEVTEQEADEQEAVSITGNSAGDGAGSLPD